MPRKNRYTGVLKPLPVGKGSPEVSLVLIYDIENDRLRSRASDICLNYGLERIQFSAFFGKLNRNRRQELALHLQREMGNDSARIRIIPVCEQDLKDMWIFDQYRRDADELKAAAEEKPRLRILSRED
ncbi:MAG TPA: CRISPR-associated endonuclease Cas2 [Bryobacteraceae bacterium]|jgi:CRISPR-associated protein Cas2|nr:CRISPR-associated endonuclease Cas2 [Bryobacteraceae bacterium]